MSTRATVDDVVKMVELAIEDQHVERMDNIAKRMVEAEPEVARLLRTIRKRRHMMFYVNTSSIMDQNSSHPLPLSVRVHGSKCGEVHLTGSDDRPFTRPNPETSFPECWEAKDVESLQWTNQSVRTYLKCAEEAARTSTRATGEAAVQAAVIRSIRKDRKQWRYQALVRYPARTNMGLPYQLPVPIRARGGARALLGAGSGHVDLLTRNGTGRSSRLRVLELKSPTARDVAASLEQAVAYAAALRIIMDRGKWYPRLLGYPNYTPPMEATAVVGDSEKARAEIGAAFESLRRSISTFPGLRLSALFYQWEPAASGQIDVTHKMQAF